MRADPRRVALVRSAWAAAAAVAPRALRTGMGLDAEDELGARVLRVLGAREVVQSAATAVAPNDAVAESGVLVDSLHALSMLGLAAVSPHYRRPALTSAAVTAGWAALGHLSRLPEPAAPGRVVVITGASSGIGRATALACSRRGDRVVLAARSRDSLLEAERECRAAGGETLVVPTDVTDAAAVDALVATAADRFGRVDAVVHSVTVVAYGRFDEVPAAAFDQVVAVTLTGAANVARTALRHFRGQGHGHLVVVGSLLGKIATPFMSSYVTAKWGLQGLVRTLQIEAQETPGIRIGLVSPGGVDTPVYHQAATYFRREGRPPPPVDPPEKVARAVLRSLDRPRREISVGLANPVTVLGFRTVPPVFDALVRPLMKVGGLTKSPVENNDGNVFAPVPAADATHGRWGRHWMRPVTAATVAAGAVLTGRRLRP